VLVFMVQFGGARYHPVAAGMLGPIVLVVLSASVGALLLPLVRVLVSRIEAAVRSRQAARRRQRAATIAEQRARMLMSELCPHGWRAQITLFERAGESELPLGPNGRPSAVALDWAEFAPELGRAVVTRRVWAPSINEALEAMVADRRTDETLEQIERGAVADGSAWPDL
jgi:hypothetical protein